MHPWVAERKGGLSVGLQVFPLPDEPFPTERLMAAGLLAEEVGLDAFFIGDHPGFQPDPWLHLAAIAARTSRIGLGSVVNCVHHRHPTMHARLLSDLDHLSGGRAILGLGIGWNEAEFAQLGLPFLAVPVRQAALEESVQIINGVLGEEPFSFDGEHWWTHGGHVRPTVQRPRPPLMIAGAGERVTLRQVAQYADISNFGSGRNVGKAKSVAEIRHKLDILRTLCEARERPYDDILKSYFVTWLMLSETEEGARAKLDHYYPDGLSDEQKLTRVATTPAGAVEQFQSLADAGIEYIVVQMLDAGDVETIRLLGTEVAPRLN